MPHFFAQIAFPVAPRVARPNSHLALRVVRWPAAFGDILQEHHSALGEDAGPIVGRRGKQDRGQRRGGRGVAVAWVGPIRQFFSISHHISAVIIVSPLQATS